jgi:polar amino acid transport system substrate-binding protein
MHSEYEEENIMKKKVLALTMAACMAASLTACGGSKTAETTAAATEAAKESAAESAATEAASEATEAAAVETLVPGKLTVATSPDFAPYEFYSIGADGTPTLSGFDMELAQYIADYLGLELVVNPMDFDGVLTDLQT